MSTLNIALIGNGRMGRMIESVCAKDEALSVAGFVGPGDCEMLSMCIFRNFRIGLAKMVRKRRPFV